MITGHYGSDLLQLKAPDGAPYSLEIGALLDGSDRAESHSIVIGDDAVVFDILIPERREIVSGCSPAISGCHPAVTERCACRSGNKNCCRKISRSRSRYQEADTKKQMPKSRYQKADAKKQI